MHENGERILNPLSHTLQCFTSALTQPLWRGVTIAVIPSSASPVMSLAARLMELVLDFGQIHAYSPRDPSSLGLFGHRH